MADSFILRFLSLITITLFLKKLLRRGNETNECFSRSEGSVTRRVEKSKRFPLSDLAPSFVTNLIKALQFEIVFPLHEIEADKEIAEQIQVFRYDIPFFLFMEHIFSLVNFWIVWETASENSSNSSFNLNC